MRLRRHAGPLAALCLVFLAVGNAAAAQGDPYGSDPLDLIALRDETRDYSSGTDSWQVWVCDVPDGSIGITPTQAANIMTGTVTPYFQAVSGTRYAPAFVAGGTVVANQSSGWPDDPFRLQTECQNLVFAQAPRAHAGALVVVDTNYAGGYATPGYSCDTVQECPTVFPDNARMVVLGAGALVSANGQPAELRTVAHEIGHAIFWSHSYGGLVEFENGIVYEYDNPMDLMSGGDEGSLNIGTIAINRYAAGWLGSDGVMFHRGGDLTYAMGATSGIQMLVLPTDVPGVFEFLGVRIRAGYDVGVPAEGIEVYRVDQSDAVCAVTPVGECYGTNRRIAQVPAVESFAATDHVHNVGVQFTVRNLTVSVISRNGPSYTVRVTGDAVAERFLDDNGNMHEQNIKAIAALGITRGCNPPLVDRFCPTLDVTRAEMAAFLVAALGESPTATYGGYFPDVPSGAWFTPYVEKLKDLGITTGNADGTYGPSRSVTRAEMAVFLTRAFGLPTGSSGSAFDDVPADEWYAPSVDSIRVAGITAGCATAPALYCPLDSVKRDQMATFLARALGL